MKITFFTLTDNLNTASYRIWVHDLNDTLTELGIDSCIVKGKFSEISKDTTVVIFCKSAYAHIDEYISQNPGLNIKIGAINIPSDYYNKHIDFVIVGSPEEYTSMSSYKDVFYYPLIERKFIDTLIKDHTENEKLRLCFHGNYPHLFKFEPFLREAIEEYNKEQRVELVVITGIPSFNWQVGKPKDVTVEVHPYDNRFSEIVKSCDIGLVPNVSDIRLFAKGIQDVTSVDYGLYNTDYFLRFKNKTNSGRAYVFYQHGLPVIHDMSPSNFEFMGKTNNFICAHNKDSWVRELRKLSSYDYRNKVAKQNYDVFRRDFNPRNHALKLIDFIDKEVISGR